MREGTRKAGQANGIRIALACRSTHPLMHSLETAMPTPFATRLRQFFYAMLAARFMEFDPRAPGDMKRK
ncbi:hypothetical protein [Paraburkholderia unamae]|nr:hypothetical protein [Paraburkholderia unamae]